MSKRPTYSPVTDRDNIATEVNDALASLVEGFDNTVSRDGSTPNTMNGDVDLNNNDIINVKNISAKGITIDGSSLRDSVDAAAASAMAAALSEAKAEEWAVNPEDVEVETGKYSSYHYSLKASADAADAANSKAAASSSADAANVSLLALGDALANDLGAFSVDGDGDLLVSYNGNSITDIEIDASGNLLMTYTE